MLHEERAFGQLNFIEEFDGQKNGKITKEANQYECEFDRETILDIEDKEIADSNNCNSSYVLSIKAKNSSSHTIHLENYLYEIGRRRDAHIILKDVAVSRYHATLVKEFNPTDSRFRYKIVDGDLSGQKNTNGLLINKKFYKTKYLEHGDLISFSRHIQAEFLVVDQKTSNENSLVDFEEKKKKVKVDQSLGDNLKHKENLSSYGNFNKGLLLNLFGEIYDNFFKIIKHLGIGNLLIQVTINISTPESKDDQSLSFGSNLNEEEEKFNQSKPINHTHQDNEQENKDEKIVYLRKSPMDGEKFAEHEQKPFIANQQDQPSLLPIQGYHVIESIGKGRFTEIYKAIHNQTQNQVALKILLPEVAADASQKDKFMDEVENTKSLKHPNLVQLLDYGVSEGISYCAFEYCELGSLYQLCEQHNSPLMPKEALSLIIPILDALDYAHNVEIPYVKQRTPGFINRKGLIHRNIHTGNILLTKRNGKIIAKIADLGIDTAFDNSNVDGLSASGQSLQGNFQFMPREQVINFKYPKPAIDIWAVAACLYYLLTLKYPRDFYNRDPHPLLTVLQKKPIPIKQRNPNIPDNLAKIIDLALEDSGKLYFQSAIEFKHALPDF